MLRTFIDTTDAGDNRWGPPLVDEDWHAICQAIFQSVGSGNPIEEVDFCSGRGTH